MFKLNSEQLKKLHTDCPKCLEKIDDLILDESKDFLENEVICKNTLCNWKGTTEELIASSEMKELDKLLYAMVTASMYKGMSTPSTSALAASTLQTELERIYQLLVDIISGKYEDTEPIIQYLLWLGIIKENENKEIELCK